MELFDTDEEKLLASQRWEKNWKDLSGIKKDLSGKIIDGLNIKIINELNLDDSINPKAYELYLKAKLKIFKLQDKNQIPLINKYLKKEYVKNKFLSKFI